MDTSDCIAWFDATDSSNFMLSGSNILKWNSKVGSNIVLQPNTTYFTSPEYIQSSKAVYFDNGQTQDGKIYPGIQQLGTLLPFSVDYSNVEQTVYIVANLLDGKCTGYNSALTIGDNATFYYAYQLNIDGSNTDRNIGGFVDMFYSSNVFPRNQPFLMCYRSRFTSPTLYSASLYVNSVNISNVIASATKPSITTVPIYLEMGGGTLSGNRTFTGYVHEAVVYNTYHSDTQRQAIENYLIEKWNIGESTQLRQSFLFYQYMPIQPIFISAQGIGQVFIFVDDDTLPLGLTFNAATNSITGIPVQTGTYNVNVYARDDRGVDTIPLQIVVQIPRILKQQSSAGAYTSMVRQYTEVNAAQNAKNNLVLPNQSLGEFMSTEPPNVTLQTVDPRCFDPNACV